MEAGEKETRKAFEKVVKNNVLAAIEHSNETRKLIRDLETNVQTLQNAVLSRDQEIQEIKNQIALLLQQMVSKGTSVGN